MRVLLADDEAVIRMGLRAMLEDAGHEVVAAVSTGEAAVQQVQTLHPDIVILDIKMPGMDGIQAARRIMAERPTPIIMLTAYSQRELVAQANQALVFAYLVKPIKEEALAPTLELARARFDEWKHLQKEAADLASSLAARQLVEQAKHLLMEREYLAERAAFLKIHRASRSRRVTMQQVAQEIIEKYK